jgi:hypothetical protein
MTYMVKKFGSFMGNFPHEEDAIIFVEESTNTSLRFAFMHLGYTIEKKGYDAACNNEARH